MNSAQIPALFIKANRPVVAVTFIALVCLTMLESNRGIFGLSSKPINSESLYAAEIDGCINYIENHNEENYFSVREQPNQMFRTKLIPLSANPGFDFCKNAVIEDFIHKAGDSDTLTLSKNKQRYYYRIEN